MARGVLVVTAVPPEADSISHALAGLAAAADGAARAGAPAARAGAAGAPGGPGRTCVVIAGGVGPAAAAAAAATALASGAYDLVVSAGIGGGFPGIAPVGGLVVADEIVAADLGAQTPDGFTPVTELGFGTVTHRPPPALAQAAAQATGAVLGTVLTVSTVTGTAARAAELRARHPRAAAEAMEGFGVAEAAARHGVPVLEIRAISNPVGPRDRAAWRVPDALAALTAAFRALAPTLSAQDRGVPPAIPPEEDV